MSVKVNVRIAEPLTKIERVIEAKAEVYPDTIAGTQRGDRWILRIGTLSITVEHRGDLLDIARAIDAKLGVRT